MSIIVPSPYWFTHFIYAQIYKDTVFDLISVLFAYVILGQKNRSN